MELTKEEIENIIENEITVDCYDEYEAASGWTIFMEEGITYPFEAEYQVQKKSGDLEWKKVKVIRNETQDVSPESDDYYFKVELDDYVVIANLYELKNIEADEDTLRTLMVWKHR